MPDQQPNEGGREPVTPEPFNPPRYVDGSLEQPWPLEREGAFSKGTPPTTRERMCRMILVQECDEPGCVTRDGVTDGYDGVAYCAVHRRAHQLADLKRARAEKMAWLELTHLKAIRKIDEQIAALEQER